MSCVCPPIAAVIAGPPPLYGTCRRSIPVMYFSSSAVMCVPVATPADA